MVEIQKVDFKGEVEYCPNREDTTHCQCWWEGGACCACYAVEMTKEEKMAQGMEEES